MGNTDPLLAYKSKRDFDRTPEPMQGGRRSKSLVFVVQKHSASHLHYDFRLELAGTLKSWAVPKGPSLDPMVKRMAVEVEDHPISYASFEGTIPAKQYGAGTVIVWDQGVWVPLGDPAEGLKTGKLKFALHGEKLKGYWTLVRMQSKGQERQKPWLLIKERDAEARATAEHNVVQDQPDSVLRGKSLSEKRRTLKIPSREKAVPLPRPFPNAPKSVLPETVSPQLATLVKQMPADDPCWVYEIKFDGYRLLTRIERRSVRCFTRNGHDWSAKLPALVAALAKAGFGSCWLDGEIVVQGAGGVPDFGALQNAFDNASTANIVYYVFDLLFYAGHDLRPLPLVERRKILRKLVNRAGLEHVRFSEAFSESAQGLLDAARKLGLEGVIGKRMDAAYRAGRSPAWIKLKTQLRQEFVIGGYTSPKSSRAGLGALLLGFYDAAGALQYAGNVGTGFDDATLKRLATRLAGLTTSHPTFANLPASVKGHWVKPRLVAEVAFAQWTHSGRLRHAVFQGLRSDKAAHQVHRETANPMEDVVKTIAQPTAEHGIGKLRVTHPDRVIDTSTGLTKLALAHYYAQVAPLILPHLKGRPVSLVRAPEGIKGALFFQKHAEATSIPGIKLLDQKLDPGHAPLLEIGSANALLAATQLNVLEFHTWNATARFIGKPDRMMFDLDPGDGVAWEQVQEAAQLVRGFLKELGLPAFLKTSGGKGLHLLVPIRRGADWDTVKGFSQAIVVHLAGVIPQRFVAKSGPRNRVGKIFIDYLRNGFGATTVCAWSARARPGMGVSVPVAWDELLQLRSGDHWRMANIRERLAVGNLPWQGYDRAGGSLPRAMKTLGFNSAGNRKSESND